MEQAVTLNIKLDLETPEVDADALLTRAEAVMGQYGPVVSDGEIESCELSLTVMVPVESPLAAVNDNVIGGFVKTMIGLGIEDCPHSLHVEPIR